jgi:hypothetical protein
VRDKAVAFLRVVIYRKFAPMERLSITLNKYGSANRWFRHEMGLVDLTKCEAGLLHQYYEV